MIRKAHRAALVTAAFALLRFAQPAVACTCALVGTAEEEYHTSDLVLMRRARPPDGATEPANDGLFEIEVWYSWKGPIVERQTIQVFSLCPPYLEEGDLALPCGRSVHATDAQADRVFEEACTLVNEGFNPAELAPKGGPRPRTPRTLRPPLRPAGGKLASAQLAPAPRETPPSTGAGAAAKFPPRVATRGSFAHNARAGMLWGGAHRRNHHSRHTARCVAFVKLDSSSGGSACFGGCAAR